MVTQELRPFTPLYTWLATLVFWATHAPDLTSWPHGYFWFFPKTQSSTTQAFTSSCSGMLQVHLPPWKQKQRQVHTGWLDTKLTVNTSVQRQAHENVLLQKQERNTICFKLFFQTANKKAIKIYQVQKLSLYAGIWTWAKKIKGCHSKKTYETLNSNHTAVHHCGEEAISQQHNKSWTQPHTYEELPGALCSCTARPQISLKSFHIPAAMSTEV